MVLYFSTGDNFGIDADSDTSFRVTDEDILSEIEQKRLLTKDY
jgi:hypothetical protein